MSRSLKILSFCPYYPPHIGGLEKYADELHSNLASRGHQVTVFTPNIPAQLPPSSIDHVHVIRFPAWEIIYNYPLPKFWLPSFWSSCRQLWQNDYDIIFSTTRFFFTSLLALSFSRLKRLPHLHIEHGSDFVKSNSLSVSLLSRLVDETLGRLIFNLSTVNIAPSQSAQRFINRFNKRSSPIIYRGLPWNQIKAIPANQQILSQHAGQTIICFAGRFISGKGVPDLIKAISVLKQKNIVLLLIGSGPEKKAYASLVKELGISASVIFTGQKSFSDTISFIKASDILINPSYNEGLPTSVLEAAACRIPIIATDVGGTAEIITNNKSGLLIPPGNIQSIISSIKTLINNHDLRSSYARHAYHSAHSKFNWSIAITQYETILYNSISSTT